MPKELLVGIEFHDHVSDFVRGLSGMLKNFPEEVGPLPPEVSFNYVETMVLKGHDNKVHIVAVPTAYLLGVVASAAYRIKGLDGSSIVPRKMPHEDDGA